MIRIHHTVDCVPYINARYLQWHELLELYRRMRTLANTKRQTVNPLHARIYQLVQKFGTPRRYGDIDTVVGADQANVGQGGI